MPFPWDFAGKIAGMALDVFQSGRENRWQVEQAQQQNRYNLQMANDAFAKQKEMFNIANVYNSPFNQMQRFKDAGLNPNLIYGQGNPGNAPNTLPQYHAPSLQANIRRPADISGAIKNWLDTAISMEQLKVLKSERRIKDNQATQSDNTTFWWPYFNEYKAGQQRVKQAFSQLDWDIANDVINQASPGSDIYRQYKKNQWMLSGKQLQNYNAQIALANARNDLLQLDIATYVPKWLQGLAGAGLNVATKLGGLARGANKMVKQPIKISEMWRKSPTGGSKLRTITYK